MAVSKLSMEERQRRKREAARLRQRRCRAKKKEKAEQNRKRIIKRKIAVKIPSAINNAEPGFSHDRSKQFTRSPRRGPTKEKKNKTPVLLDLCSPHPSQYHDHFNNVTPTASNSLQVYGALSPKLQSSQDFLQMPPLPSVHNSAAVTPNSEHNAQNISCFSSSQEVDECELSAAGAMLSLRHSPVPDSFRQKYSLSPRSTVGLKVGAMAPPPIPGFHKVAVEEQRTHLTSCQDKRPVMTPRRHQYYPVAPKQVHHQEDFPKYHYRVDSERRSLSPGIYFFYH